MTHSWVSAVSATLAGMSCGVLAGWLSQMGLPPLLPVALLVLFVGPALACVVLGKMGVVHARDGLASGVAAAASFGIYWSAAIRPRTILAGSCGSFRPWRWQFSEYRLPC
jgi:hypothetical protein